MIKWNEKFSVGYKVFDEQHIKLIEILNDGGLYFISSEVLVEIPTLNLPSV